MKRTLLAAVMLAGMTLAAQAADIRYEGKTNGASAITIAGRIVRGDSEKFQRIAATVPAPAIVVLSSPGGLVFEGLDIGETIRRNGYATGVPDQMTCASTCGLIWLAGTKRFIASTSKVGFHAAYNAQEGHESGMGNALVGSYLTDLNLSKEAIAYATMASPHEMAWLHPSDATRLGITFQITDAEPVSAKGGDQPSYQEGRQARLDYERWVTALPDGGFKDGVLFWAAHRSDRPPPACTGGVEFMTGCITAKSKLTPIDEKRLADRNFWSGWNSL
jgi:ATP-dependent protease ClpP protease subunit